MTICSIALSIGPYSSRVAARQALCDRGTEEASHLVENPRHYECRRAIRYQHHPFGAVRDRNTLQYKDQLRFRYRLSRQAASVSREQLRENSARSNPILTPQRRECTSRSSTVCVRAVHDARPGLLGTPGLVLFGLPPQRRARVASLSLCHCRRRRRRGLQMCASSRA